VGNPSLTPKLPWAQKDLAPVALITVATNVIAVHPSVPANNLQEFIAYLKKNPGRLSYASQGNGSLSHMGTEMFKMQTGTSMVHIPYRGSGRRSSRRAVRAGAGVHDHAAFGDAARAGRQAEGLRGHRQDAPSGLPQVPTTARPA
jgi:tripartite-type tricarboxylate transporter receptor subunit TctC